MTFSKLMLTVAALLITFASFSASAAAETSSVAAEATDNSQAVMNWLASPVFIVSRSELRRIDADPVPELIKIANNPRAGRALKSRAIKSLSLFRDARVQTAFEGMLKRRPGKLFGILVMAHMEAFGEDGVPAIAKYLKHRSVNVRHNVVKALGMFGGQAGYDLLVERAEVESNPGVLAMLNSYTH